ncbi:thermonuclease family protein [Veronia pacifica]|uniref:TNase-like domain-containing protein n=1 Tax=Veronia pacifica TaxID=1080227 RepID=A0A1C3E507_9GAMM|nr:thermonuclease family protein [Veronia pacifica]ODA28331.1 hypothetical protein A8L45_23220 [Veronia pacifica]
MKFATIYTPLILKSLGKRVHARVKGLDAPEIHGKCEFEKQKAREAKQFTVALLRGAEVIRLTNIERCKYFRLLADVEIDGEQLAEKLIKAWLARPYDGGKRLGWCS